MRKTLLGFAMLIIIAGCKKEEKEPALYTEEAISGPVLLTPIPLKEGNQWTYTIISPGDEKNEYRTINYTCSPETKIGEYSFYKLMLPESSVYQTGPLEYDLSQYYLTSTAHGLYATDSLNLDPASFYDSTTCIVKYNIEKNSGWSTYKPMNSRRMAVGFVRVTAPAGTFDCVKLQVEYYDLTQPKHSPYVPALQDLYFSSKGLIMAIQTHRTPPSSPGVGYLTTTNTMVLTSTNF